MPSNRCVAPAPRLLSIFAGLVAFLGATPATAGPPRSIYISANEYPSDVQPGAEALRVRVRYELGDDGRFTLCEVRRSSGQPSIDAASCQLLLKRARFRPEPDTRRGTLALVWGNAASRTPNPAGAPIPVSLHDEIYDTDYPAEAVRREQSGTVEYEVEVSATGVPQRCTIATSSGSEILDQRTCQIVMERSAFIAAANGAGDPTRGTYRSRITWRIDVN